MSMNIIFTVCNRSNLANALVLGKSVAQFPGSVFYLCWADTEPLPKISDQVKMVPISAIKLPQWNQMASSYYDFELLPASRPWFAKYLLDINPDSKTIAFLAPTVCLYKPIEEVINDKSGIFVTPHISDPLKKSEILDDKRILNIGMFHAGSWAMNRTEESLAFLDWWAIRTIDRAKFDLCNGMCMDQLWLNFALVRIPDAVQITNKGWHYGLHSILNKDLTVENGSYFVDKKPLISIDFAGLDYFNPIWSDHVELLSQSKTFQKIYSEYQKNLSGFKSSTSSELKPGYGIIPEIKSNRLARKSAIAKLKSITRFIDQF